jgi:hypothetical protein
MRGRIVQGGYRHALCGSRLLFAAVALWVLLFQVASGTAHAQYLTNAWPWPHGWWKVENGVPIWCNDVHCEKAESAPPLIPANVLTGVGGHPGDLWLLSRDGHYQWVCLYTPVCAQPTPPLPVLPAGKTYVSITSAPGMDPVGGDRSVTIKISDGTSFTCDYTPRCHP